MKTAFSRLKGTLEAGKVAFTYNGASRLNDDDIVEFQPGCTIEPHSAFLDGYRLWEMGSFSYSWSSLPITAKVGRYCSIAGGLSFLGTRHPLERISSSSFTYDKDFVIFSEAAKEDGPAFQTQEKPQQDETIGIAHDVWIGANVVLKPGITIGSGAVVAANSVVVKDVPAFSICGGNPAKHIKWRFPEETIHKILASAWWNYKFTDFSDLDFSDPIAFVAKLEEKIALSKIQEYKPKKVVL